MSRSKFIPRPPNNLIIDMDRETMEALRTLAEMVAFNERTDFISKVCSLLLVSLIAKNREDYSFEDTNAFERICTQATILKLYSHNKLWGEFLVLRKVFLARHRDQDMIAEELISHTGHYELRVYPEEFFVVQINKSGTAILVS